MKNLDEILRDIYAKTILNKWQPFQVVKYGSPLIKQLILEKLPKRKESYGDGKITSGYNEAIDDITKIAEEM